MVGSQGKFQPHKKEDGGRGESVDKLRQPPGQPYADGWPQQKVAEGRFGSSLGLSTGERPAVQSSMAQHSCGGIQDPEEWGREGESTEKGRVKHSNERL